MKTNPNVRKKIAACLLGLLICFFAAFLAVHLGKLYRAGDETTHSGIEPTNDPSATVAGSMEAKQADRVEGLGGATEGSAGESATASGALPVAAGLPGNELDIEGGRAPRIERGLHGRRILDTHVNRTPLRDNPEPIRPFGQARAALKDEAFARENEYVLSAAQVGISHRLFHEAARGERHRMTLPIEQDSEITADLELIVDRGEHTFSFIGTVEEHPDSVVILVYNEGTVSGGVTFYGATTQDTKDYQFVSFEQGQVEIRRMDPRMAEHDHCETCAGCGGGHRGEEEEHPDYENIVPGGGFFRFDVDENTKEHVVDIVVGYSKRVRIADGGIAAIEGRIISSVDRFNRTLSNSEIDNLCLVLLGMLEDPDFDDTTDNRGLISGGLADGDNGTLDEVRNLRDTLGADLVSFIYEGSGGSASNGGFTSRIGREGMSNTNLTFVHEIGHNFTLAHAVMDATSSRYLPQNARTDDYFGWLFHHNGVRRRTIMAYAGTGSRWTRVMYFSNPDVTYPGFPDWIRTGVPRGYNANDTTNASDDDFDTEEIAPDSSSDIRAVVLAPNRSRDYPLYDGTNPQLGANSARNVREYAGIQAARLARTVLAVTRPIAGADVDVNQSLLIEWVGGVAKDSARVELMHGDQVVSTIRQSVANISRSITWDPPADLASGHDYRIRVTMIEDGTSVLSAAFTIPANATYETWAANMSLDGTVGNEAGFGDDPDGDGIANGLEWILGGNPLDGQSRRLVNITATAGSGLTLSFTRNPDAISHTTLAVEYNTDLGPVWESVAIGTSSSSEANGIEIIVDTDSDPHDITVNIPESNAPEGRFFTRLKASKP